MNDHFNIDLEIYACVYMHVQHTELQFCLLILKAGFEIFIKISIPKID